ncbi:hypothetical protein QTG56_24070 (plasmid) [Rossellomorea sp. AcN35-11]|nr:hypothetical protein [Rossellomorea aquimaris]WJV31716.1 hypothetical protein QTG56_24070 [Rossellomorea sp. AcN35-11]
MKQSVSFECKRYKGGWSVWIKGGTFKKLLASKLKSEYEVYKYIYAINNKAKYIVIS